MRVCNKSSVVNVSLRGDGCDGREASEERYVEFWRLVLPTGNNILAIVHHCDRSIYR